MTGKPISSAPPYTQWSASNKKLLPLGFVQTALVMPGGSVQAGSETFKSPEHWLQHLRGEKHG